jgi:hypothetical protein
MHIAIWIVVALGLALWSLTAWGVGTLLGLDPSWVGDLKPLVAQVPYAALIDAWLPGWQALLVATLELTHTLLGWAGGAGQVLVWVLWALGSALIVGGGVLLSVMVGLGRKAAAAAATRTATA